MPKPNPLCRPAIVLQETCNPRSKETRVWMKLHWMETKAFELQKWRKSIIIKVCTTHAFYSKNQLIQSVNLNQWIMWTRHFSHEHFKESYGTQEPTLSHLKGGKKHHNIDGYVRKCPGKANLLLLIVLLTPRVDKKITYFSNIKVMY